MYTLRHILRLPIYLFSFSFFLRLTTLDYANMFIYTYIFIYLYIYLCDHKTYLHIFTMYTLKNSNRSISIFNLCTHSSEWKHHKKKKRKKMEEMRS